MSPNRRQAPIAIATLLSPVVAAVLLAALPLEPRAADATCPHCGSERESASTEHGVPSRLASHATPPRQP